MRWDDAMGVHRHLHPVLVYARGGVWYCTVWYSDGVVQHYSALQHRRRRGAVGLAPRI